MPLSTRPRRVAVYTVLVVSLLLAIVALWKALGTQTTATDLGAQVANACQIDRGDAQRKGLDCTQAESVAPQPGPVTLTPPAQTSLVLLPGPPVVLTQTQQVPLPLPTIVQLPGATNTIVTVLPGEILTETVIPAPQTVTQTQTQTETQTVTVTAAPETTSDSPAAPLRLGK